LAQRGQDGRGPGAGLWSVPPGLPLLARAGQLGDEAPGLAATELARDRLQNRTAEIR
jgi:hypothetical protein